MTSDGGNVASLAGISASSLPHDFLVGWDSSDDYVFVIIDEIRIDMLNVQDGFMRVPFVLIPLTRSSPSVNWMNFLPGPNFGARVTELQSGKAPERQNVNSDQLGNDEIRVGTCVCKNKIESEESSDEEVVSFTRRVINRISSNSNLDDEESYASEDLEDVRRTCYSRRGGIEQ
ncbi:hypothetical protein WN51_10046 [Melipona quadrifasciata]|uniref:Uncharacterized protein n=1 Tax=Melipona quadrifasciata TaxID=166423 RepID=A0A0N0U7M3_9HYME|nr:hypothetical protein WN51_10046 [Melipona quadrifasciata]